MTPAGAPDDGVNAFLVEDRVLFSHYFDESEVFAALKPYYDNHGYRFEVPIAVFPNVLAVLVRHGYDVTYHRDASDFVVAVKQYSQHPDDIFKQSVDHRGVDNWNCFLLRSRAAVERAIRTHARPIANAPVRDPFDFAIRTDAIERRETPEMARLSLSASPGELERGFDVAVPDDYVPRYNVAPGDALATLTNERPGRLDRFHWGLVPFWAANPDESPRPLTAPAATLDEAPMVAEAFRHRRCLVLVDGFYVWQSVEASADEAADDGESANDGAEAGASGAGARTAGESEGGRTTRPYRITTRDERPVAVAGIWEVWAARGSSRRSVAVVTTEADEAVRDVTERLPVILDGDARSRWLEATDPGTLDDVLTDGSAVDLHVYPVSRAVVDPTNDGPAVAEPVDRSRQVGLDAFSEGGRDSG